MAGLHTNDDDFMKYYWEIFEVNNDRMLISMAMIGDHDGLSGVARIYILMSHQHQHILVMNLV